MNFFRTKKKRGIFICKLQIQNVLNVNHGYCDACDLSPNTLAQLNINLICLIWMIKGEYTKWIWTYINTNDMWGPIYLVIDRWSIFDCTWHISQHSHTQAHTNASSSDFFCFVYHFSNILELLEVYNLINIIFDYSL